MQDFEATLFHILLYLIVIFGIVGVCFSLVAQPTLIKKLPNGCEVWRIYDFSDEYHPGFKNKIVCSGQKAIKCSPIPAGLIGETR